MGVEVTELEFKTNKGVVVLDVWDCAGQTKFNSNDGHRLGAHEDYQGANGAIIFFDVCSKSSYQHVSEWAQQTAAPVTVVCGNKVDLPKRQVLPHDIKVTEKYYDVSAKSCYNYEKPFLYLIRKFLGEDTNFEE